MGKESAQKGLSRQAVSSERFREDVLEMLWQMTLYHRLVIRAMGRARFEGFGDPQFLENIQNFMATSVSLYKILKPKINDLPNKDNFAQLSEFNKYEQELSNLERSDLESLFNTFGEFTKLVDNLRELAEELGYTKTKMVEPIQT